MSACPFCNPDPSPSPSASPASAPIAPGPPAANPHGSAQTRPAALFRRAWQGIQWLTPAMLLVAIPKCPLCLAAYVAVFTGIGVSVSTARWIQMAMLALCVMSLAYLAMKTLKPRRRKAIACMAADNT